MKNKVLIWGLILIAAMLVFSGCAVKADNSVSTAAPQSTASASVPSPAAQSASPTPEAGEGTNTPAPEIDYMQVYASVLDDFYAVIVNGSDWDFDIEGATGVWEVTMGAGSDEALQNIGYTILDISGDDIPELVIGGIEESDGSDCYGSIIYAVFSCANGTPTCTLEGWGRNSYSWMSEGRFLNRGSSGAMYSILATYTISPNGTSLICDDYYFTFEKDENFEQIGYYHNTTGEWDKSVSEEMDITGEEFWEMETELEDRITNVELTRFSEYAA